MNRRMRKTERSVVLGVVFLVMSIVSVLAAGHVGTDPDSAMAPVSGSVAIGPGESHWYTFRDEGDNGQVVVEMDVAGAATFAVWTPGNVAQWRSGEKVTPVGVGTANANVSANLFWMGNFNESGNYYVVVSQGESGNSNYQLRIRGRDVWFPVQAKAAAPEEAPMQVDSVSGGQSSGADATDATSRIEADAGRAAAATGAQVGAHSLAAGGIQLYSFSYDGKQDQILVTLDSSPDSAVSFSVWTPELWRQRGQGQVVEPVGRGTKNPFVSGDLSWTGNFTGLGTYYVEMRNRSGQDAGYTLTVTGGGVGVGTVE